MHRLGHYGAALVVYSPTVAVLVAVGLEAFALIGGLVVLAFAMVPDKDQNLPFVSHRGITHTVHFAALIGGVLAVGGGLVGITAGIGTAVSLAVFGFVVGFGTIASHIAADALTPMGIEPFRNGRRYSFDLVKAANPIANYVLLALGIAAVGLAFVVGTTAGAVV